MKHKTKSICFATLLFFGLMFSLNLKATVIFVDAEAVGLNSGTSWTDAFTSFQSALDAAVSGDEIWVAKGTYKPSSAYNLTNTSRYYHFELKAGVDVYGGFAGSETSIEERENYGQGEANETILSGDLNGDDVGFNNNTENCYHVIYNHTTSINAIHFDGVTVSGGNANGSGDHAKGGGMFNYKASNPLLNHIVFSGNSAVYGGGMYSYNNYLTHTSVTYKNNIADYGGGICIQGGITDIKFHNCIISGNKANFDGGGVFIEGARFLPINTTITGNHADGNGGGIYVDNSFGPQSDIRNSILWGNTANSGTQVYTAGSNDPDFYYSDLQGGSAGIGLSSGTYSGIYQNNIDADPNFITDVPSPAPSAGGDLHLLNDYPTNSSPCFEAGNNDYLQFGPTTDFDGENRIQVEHVDIGAYEGGNYSTSPIIYVDINATGNNDGITWANAFTDLQWALLIARTCPGFTTINVAAGTYKPTSGTDRAISFAMVNGISILGGYPTGGGTRDWENNETNLSGDLSDNDDFDVTNYGFQGTSGDDNSYHVIYNDSLINLNTTAVLDGFTISGGYAPIEDTQTPIDYTPGSGGGMCNLSASPKVINCTFTGNQALVFGGGMYNYNGASPDVSNCTFYENITYRHALCGGAGIANRYESSPTVDSCDFISNYSCVGAAGMYNETACDAVVTNCLFSENILFMDPIQQWTNYGAGMINYSSQPVIIDCIFSGNVAGYWGRAGAMYNAQSAVILTNVAFINNTAQHFGGAIFTSSCWESVYTNCTFFGNSTDWYGGAIFFQNSAGLYENSIFWGNTAGTAGDQICFTLDHGETDFYHCDMQGGTAAFGFTDGSGTYTGNYVNNIDTDPLFVDASNNDLRLYGNSPAVNTGNNSYNAEPTDLRGQARIQNITIDMGAYEWTAGLDPYMSTGNTIYVNVNASGANNGSGWADAFTSLQSALDVAISGNAVWVAKGTYKPNSAYDLTNTSRYYHFRLNEGVEIYGGFAGTETAVSQRTNFGSGEANETILSGDLSNNDNFDVNNGGYQGTTGDDNCYHVLFHPDGLNLTSATVFDGFTITGGNANGAADPHNKAGALYLYSSSPTIQNVNFHSNEATGFGGAAYIYNSTSEFSTVSFSENTSGGGGAFYISYASPVLNNSIFTGNVSSGDGGALSTHSSSPTLTNALFSSNTAGNNGGAIIFYSNSAQYNATLNNVTLSDNQANANGGGIRFASNNAASTLNMNNSIVWGNTAATSGNELSLVSTGTTTLNYSCYKNETNDVVVSNGTLTATNNNTTFNPGFFDPVSGDFRIRGFSPCKDNGLNGYNALPTDIRGQNRIQNTTIDMGAYEWTEGIDPQFNAENVLYVVADGMGANNGSSWDDAFTSLQSAMDNAPSGSQIWVAKGTYKPSYDYGLMGGSHLFHFRLIEGVEIYGGFAGTETAVSQRTNFGLGEANETILSGDLSGDDDFDVNNGGYQGTTGDDNCAHVLYHPDGLNLTGASVLDGFTIAGGNANGPDPHIKAGGLYLYSSSPTIQNVIFKSNQAIELGGAAYIYNSTSEFSNVSFIENISGGGGGLYVSIGIPVINNAIFTGNVSSADGGALSTHSASPTLTNALFSSNKATYNGGAIIFYSNSVQFNATINNLTLSDNQAGGSGGAIRFASNNATSTLNMNNSIVWGNTATTSGNELSLVSTGTTTLNYSCYKNETNDVVVSNGTFTATNNNISGNPLFVNASGDYRLFGNSPCVNTGLNSYNSLSEDIRGQNRIQNTTIDMGAYEWTSGVDPSTNILTWTGSVSSDWSNASNWVGSGQVPTAAFDAVIPDVTIKPIIEIAAEINDLAIESGGVLTIADNGSLSVNGILANAAGNDGFLIQSTASGTGSLIHQTAGVEATAQRYIPEYVSGATGWHYLSSPVVAQPIRPEFVASPTPNPNDDFYKFSEPQYIWINTKDDDGNWDNNFEANFVVGRGYGVAYADYVTKIFSGELNAGDFTFDGTTTPAITYTAEGGIGWNLMGNPYPSGLDWDLCQRTNIDGAVYVYDGNNGQYLAWNGTVGSLANGIVPPMNAFFVKASENPSLTILNDARVHTTANFYKSENFVEDLLVLKVEGNGLSDLTYIHFNPDASEGFDHNFDAYKLSGIEAAPQLYTKTGDTQLSINELPYSTEEITIPLSLQVGQDGEYTISVAQNTFWQTVDISLKDLEADITYNLITNNSITISQSTNNSPDRFLLLINGATGIEENLPEDNGIEIYSYGNQVFVKTDEPGKAQVAVYNLLGQKVLHRNLSGFEDLTGLEIQVTGYYLVTVSTDKAWLTKKVFIK